MFFFLSQPDTDSNVSNLVHADKKLTQTFLLVLEAEFRTSRETQLTGCFRWNNSHVTETGQGAAGSPVSSPPEENRAWKQSVCLIIQFRIRQDSAGLKHELNDVTHYSFVAVNNVTWTGFMHVTSEHGNSVSRDSLPFIMLFPQIMLDTYWYVVKCFCLMV